MSDENNAITTQLQLGDVAKVKSGGHPMTILSISEDIAKCVYEESYTHELKEADYPLVILQRETEMTDDTDAITTQPESGDVVELKSGGRQMTILSISGDTAKCVYEDKPGNLNEVNYPLIVLKKIDNPPQFIRI